MNKLLILITLVSFSGFSQSKYELASKDRQIRWKGSNIVGGGHEGTLNLYSGGLKVSADGKVTGGEFIMDMNTIESIDDRSKTGIPELDEHLKSDDFFSVTRFPQALLSIMEVKLATPVSKPDQYLITGLLTIKGITNQISFPASITIEKDIVKVKGDLVINRTRWDIIYHSANFFANLKDDVIADDIGISVDLVFLKK